MYALYGHPRYFMFKRKHQQYGPCFQTIFPFLRLCNDPPFSFNIIELYDFNTPFTMANTIWRFAVVPVACISIIIVLNFAIRLSESRFGLPFRLKIVFEFPNFDDCSQKSTLWIIFIKTFYCSFGSMNEGICSKFCFDLFLAHWWCGFFKLDICFIWFSMINNSDSNTSSVVLATRVGTSALFRPLKS